MRSRLSCSQVGERSRGIYPVGLLRQTLADAVGPSAAMELYLTETKLTAGQAHELGLAQAVTHSTARAQQFAHEIAHLYAQSDHETGLLALSGELLASDRLILAIDAFAQAASLQAGARATGKVSDLVVFTSSGELLHRGKLRGAVQAALVSCAAQPALTTEIHWREAAYAKSPAGGATEDALARLQQLLGSAQAEQSPASANSVPADEFAAQPSEAALTPLATMYTSIQAERSEATPLDVLMDAYDKFATSELTAVPSDAVAHTGPEPSPCVLLLRRTPSISNDRPQLVIAHSLLGDHRGYGRLWSSALQESDVYALRHRGLAGADVYSLDREGAMSMAGEYASALAAATARALFDLVGASFGAILASHVACAARAAAGCPRRLVLIDPPPMVPGTLPVPKMLTNMRNAAMGVLLLDLQIEMGASVWEQFPQLQTLPEEALACFVAAQCFPERGMSRDSLEAWVERVRRLLCVYRQCRHAFHMLSVSDEPIAQLTDGSPVILTTLSSERWPTFREMFPGIKEDIVEQYGPSATLQLPGKHIRMINQCLGNREPAFTGAVERFLSDSFADAWWWSEAMGHALPAVVAPRSADLLFPLLAALSTSPSAAYESTRAESTGTGSAAVEVEAAVKEVAHELLSSRASHDAPLMEAGLDSLGAVEFRSRLSRRLGDMKLPETLVFDFPTLRQVETHVLHEAVGKGMAPRNNSVPGGRADILQLISSLAATTQNISATPPAADAIARKASAEIRAATSTLGSGVHGVASAWGAGASSSDAVGTVPVGRWDAPVTRRVSYGAFMYGIQLFDHRSFGLAPAEAELMDPHQRLALEGGYSALHGGGLERAALMGSATGVYAGIWQSDYSSVLLARDGASRGPYAVAASSCSMLVGRISYTLGLQGPSIPYDTACSSSLSASHAALSALQRSETGPALVLGVNIMCASSISELFAVAQMTSPTGRSYTFDSRADGYARGEACCCAVLQLERAEPAESGFGRYEAGAVRQDGKSASLTAPNGMAQQALLRTTLERAGRAADGAFLLEAHGTGTSLGDPIEARAMSTVRDQPQLMAAAGCKASFGHTEPTAGLTGMLRLSSMIVQQHAVTPNTQLRAINPHVAAAMCEGRRPMLPVQLACLHEARVGGVSSFGLNGTIAHALLALECTGEQAHAALTRSAKAASGRAQATSSQWERCYSVTDKRPSLFYRRRAFPLHGLQQQSVKAPAVRTIVTQADQHRWHYDFDWVCVSDGALQLAFVSLELLTIGSVRPTLSSLEHAVTWMDDAAGAALQRKHAVVLNASSDVAKAELWTVDTALCLLQSVCQGAMLPVWLCTPRTQPLLHVLGPSHAGLWGLARSCRQEYTSLPAWCLDMQESACGLMTLHRHHGLQLSSGSVRGLQLNTSAEPEAACHGTTLLVPRLVMPHNAQPAALHLVFGAVCDLLDAHTSEATAVLDIQRLKQAYASLESLCQQYLRGALRDMSESSVPVWHHKLLHGWCAKQQLPPTFEHVLTPADLCSAYPNLSAEAPLIERCGSRFGDALSGTVAYQELLFPSGSMAVVLPVYEDAVNASFYNGCIVAAVEAVLALLPNGRLITTIEVGAGSGGTASSVLSVIESSCERYVFTDVSEVFLRQARVRFADIPYLEYVLLNIDADPRLQGFSLRQYDLLISTNCLHATPFMRNTMRHCEQLLCAGGMLVVNEGLATIMYVQMTFGMTDGWWLFSEVGDPERVGQDSPLLSWRQWQAQLVDSSFQHSYCMQGDAFLRGQAVVVAQSFLSREIDARASLGDGAHFLSGGLGGLGLLTARLLFEDGVQQLVLSSRSNRVVAGCEGEWAWLAKSDAEVVCVRCDASDDGGVRAIVRGLCGDNLRLHGVFHAAHALADAYLANQHALNFRTTYGPKVHGGAALHATTSCTPLRFFNMFSSVAGLLGAPGQAPHSAANAWLDAMVGWRRSCAMRGQSINWGAVAEVGYAARHGADRLAEAAGLGAISRAMTLGALSSMLLPACRSFVVLPADWSKLLSGSAEARGLLAPYFHLRGCAAAKSATAANITSSALRTPSISIGLEVVLELVQRTAGSFVDADAPLMEAGIDSLGAIELRNQLQSAAGESLNEPLPATLTLDYPTARKIAASFQTQERTREMSHYSGLAPNEASLALICGTGTLLPGGVRSLEQLLCQSLTSVDNVTRVPSSRWENLSDELEGQGTGFGAMAHGVQLFDSMMFRVSSVEASSMDPAQRLLLEFGYEALHSGAFNRASLEGEDVGVLLGVDKCDWMFARPSSAATSVYTMSSAANNIAAGRTCYTLGMQGPCVTYDTACSSALTAAHGGLRVIQFLECEATVVQGVNIILNPVTHAAFFIAGLASPTGRSHVFDNRADGMGRGEACCTLLLRVDHGQMSSSLALTGVAVRQDGRSSSLTAPNGPAQQHLFIAAIRDAGFQPAQVALCEAHGTGTKLGDPIEARSLRVAVLDEQSGVSTAPLVTGALKASTAHTEGASGLPGLLKMATMLASKQIVPNAQLRTLNAHVQAAFTQCDHCLLPTNVGIGASDALPLGVVNAFGFSGTIATALLSVPSESLAVQPALFANSTVSAALTYRRAAFPWREESSNHASLIPAHATLMDSGLSGAHTSAQVFTTVLQIATELLPGSSNDTPLTDAGLDSLAMLELRNQLRTRVRSTVDLNATWAYDFPTPRALASHIAASVEADGADRPDVYHGIGDATRKIPLQAVADVLFGMPVEAGLPLSTYQSHFFLLHRLQPHIAMFSLPLMVLWEVEYPRHIIDAALSLVTRRHAILRTHYVASQGQTQQIVLPVGFVVPLDTCTKSQWSERCRQVVSTPFALMNAPPVRGLLVSAQNTTRLLLVVDHVAADAASLDLLENELRAACDALRQGMSPELPPIALQYADYAIWQQQAAGQVDAAAILTWWQDKLKGASPLLQLPVDHARVPVHQAQGSIVEACMKREVGVVLSALCKRDGVSISCGFLASWATFMMLLSGQDDVTLGLPYSARQQHAVLHNLVGCFAAPVPLRIQAPNRATGHWTNFHEAIHHVYDELLQGER